MASRCSVKVEILFGGQALRSEEILGHRQRNHHPLSRLFHLIPYAVILPSLSRQNR